MTKTVHDLAEAATKLPAADRALLAEQILATLDEADLEHAWREEAVQRRDEVRSGRVTPIEASEVYRRIDSLLSE
jgi:hypothetical protein